MICLTWSLHMSHSRFSVERHSVWTWKKRLLNASLIHFEKYSFVCDFPVLINKIILSLVRMIFHFNSFLFKHRIPLNKLILLLFDRKQILEKQISEDNNYKWVKKWIFLSTYLNKSLTVTTYKKILVREAHYQCEQNQNENTRELFFLSFHDVCAWSTIFRRSRQRTSP